jgi:hypothetical protein
MQWFIFKSYRAGRFSFGQIFVQSQTTGAIRITSHANISCRTDHKLFQQNGSIPATVFFEMIQYIINTARLSQGIPFPTNGVGYKSKKKTTSVAVIQ